MHDYSASISGGQVLATAGFVLILLVSIPLIFRVPASTIRNPWDIAVHSYQLSLSGSVWRGDIWNFGQVIEKPDNVVFGSYEYYPYRIFTARDDITGDALIAVTSRSSIPEGGCYDVYGDEMHLLDTCRQDFLLILIHEDDAPSWPERLFSIITRE